MTKISDINSAFIESRKEFAQYREKSWGFGALLATKYKAFLGASDDQFRIVPTNEEPKPRSTYSIMGAMNLEQDGYWHFGVILALGGNGYMPQQLQIEFRVKKVDDAYQVIVKDEHVGFTVRPDSEQDFSALFDFLQDEVVAYYREGLKRFLEQDNPQTKIGFL